MVHNPQAPQGSDGNPDPAGSTQMFRAYVDEGSPQGRAQRPAASSGPRVGVIVGVIAAVVVVVGVAWLALS